MKFKGKLNINDSNNRGLNNGFRHVSGCISIFNPRLNSARFITIGTLSRFLKKCLKVLDVGFILYESLDDLVRIGSSRYIFLSLYYIFIILH